MSQSRKSKSFSRNITKKPTKVKKVSKIEKEPIIKVEDISKEYNFSDELIREGRISVKNLIGLFRAEFIFRNLNEQIKEIKPIIGYITAVYVPELVRIVNDHLNHIGINILCKIEENDDLSLKELRKKIPLLANILDSNSFLDGAKQNLAYSDEEKKEYLKETFLTLLSDYIPARNYTMNHPNPSSKEELIEIEFLSRRTPEVEQWIAIMKKYYKDNTDQIENWFSTMDLIVKYIERGLSDNEYLNLIELFLKNKYNNKYILQDVVNPKDHKERELYKDIFSLPILTSLKNYYKKWG